MWTKHKDTTDPLTDSNPRKPLEILLDSSLLCLYIPPPAFHRFSKNPPLSATSTLQHDGEKQTNVAHVFLFVLNCSYDFGFTIDQKNLSRIAELSVNFEGTLSPPWFNHYVTLLTKAPLPEVVPGLEIAHPTEHPHSLIVHDRGVRVSRARSLLLYTLTVRQVPHLLLCEHTHIINNDTLNSLDHTLGLWTRGGRVGLSLRHVTPILVQNNYRLCDGVLLVLGWCVCDWGTLIGHPGGCYVWYRCDQYMYARRWFAIYNHRPH